MYKLPLGRVDLSGNHLWKGSLQPFNVGLKLSPNEASRNQRGLRGLEVAMGPSPPQSDPVSIFPANPRTQEYRVWKVWMNEIMADL